jgi:hypothetical protein
MDRYEYRVIAAPARGAKVKGLKTPEERFASALASALNAQAQEGWEFVRAETLPSEERQGLTGMRTIFHNMLVFRRAAGVEQPAVPGAPLGLIEDRSGDTDTRNRE